MVDIHRNRRSVEGPPDPEVARVIVHVSELTVSGILTTREALPILSLIARLAGENEGLRKTIRHQKRQLKPKDSP